MLKFEKTVSAALIMGALLVTLSACQKKAKRAEGKYEKDFSRIDPEKKSDGVLKKSDGVLK